MRISRSGRLRYASMAAFFVTAFAQAGSALATSGSVVYSYDALGRVISATYDTNVIVYYNYDANGNRTQQVVNVNTLNLCLNTTMHSNPTTWGAGLFAPAASGC